MSDCTYPVNSVLSVAVRMKSINVFDEEFYSLSNCSYVLYQTWQDGGYLNWLPPIKLFNTLVKWSCTITWKTKTIILLLPHCLWLPLKSIDPSITWSCWIAWQTKTLVSPLPHCLWPPNLASLQLTLRGSHPVIRVTL